ncbi:MAG: hypothetical protein IVW57_16835 [Ktedonobacterales bacterium]|nr:hypothetical protein [Ktedonobacterales bacterium]
MKIFDPIHRLPRRLRLVGMGAALALGMALPVTALAAPAAPSVCDLACVQNFGNLKIANRLTDLTALSGKVTNQLNAGHITSSDASALQGDVTTNTNGLTTLKGQLDSASTIQAARQDVHLIYFQYRIYAVVLPRDYRILALDVAKHVDGALRALQPTLEKAIANAPSSEQQQLNTLYSDFKAQLQEAEAQIDAAQGQVNTLTPQNFDNANAIYKTAWQDFVNDEKAVRTDIHQAGADLHQISQILKGNSSGTPTVVASPTA